MHPDQLLRASSGRRPEPAAYSLHSQQALDWPNHTHFTGSQTWPSANAGMFVPVFNPVGFDATHVWMYEGSGGTDSYKILLYDRAGNLLGNSGAIALGGSQASVLTSITSFYVPPGDLYIGLAVNGVTANNIGRAHNATQARWAKTIGICEAASVYASPPDPITLADNTNFLNNITPFGIVRQEY